MTIDRNVDAVAGIPPTGSTAAAAPRARDADAVTAVISGTASAFNAKDAAALADTFTVDAWCVEANGQVLRGREEILDSSRQQFAGPLGSQLARYDVDDVREVAPGVAVVRTVVHAIDAGGNDLDIDHTMVALYVLVRGDAGWRVAARQSTLAPR